MKKLTREEAHSIKGKPNGKSSYARGLFLGMEMGEIILLEPKDWNQKTRAVSTYCLMLGRKMGRKWDVKTAMDGSGWVVERVK